jgi:hypothetical protein
VGTLGGPGGEHWVIIASDSYAQSPEVMGVFDRPPTDDELEAARERAQAQYVRAEKFRLNEVMACAWTNYTHAKGFRLRHPQDG